MNQMDLNFDKICRVCLKEGNMVSIFKAHIYKKIMSCAEVQVWQNDGLPTEICMKCLANLHISVQFKRICEKSNAQLRQLLFHKKKSSGDEASDNADDGAKAQIPRIHMDEIATQIEPDKKTQVQPIANKQSIDDLQAIPNQVHSAPSGSLTLSGSQSQSVTSLPPQDCLYLECTPLIQADSTEFNNFSSTTDSEQSTSSQFNFIQPTQDPLHATGNNLLETNHVQGYSGTNGFYTMAIQNNVSANNVYLVQQPAVVISNQPTFVLNSNCRRDNDAEKEKKESENSTDTIEKKPTFQCNVCSKHFLNAAKLARHTKIHSKDMSKYKCKVCSKSFSHRGNYKIHLRMHTDERPYKCSVCNRGCRQAQDLEKHMRIHTGERPHKCTFCPRAFSTSSNLSAHIRIHTGERPYVCCVCQKAFCQSNELTKHMRTHTGEKTHFCDICSKGFNGSNRLVEHRRSHTGEKPYVCKYCDRGYALSRGLLAHLKHHENESEEKFICTVCDKQFVSEKHLSDHMRIDECPKAVLIVND